MFIDCQLTPHRIKLVPGQLNGHTAVPIDVFRASSTIITAISNGCRSIIPAVSESEISIMTKHLRADEFVTAGERNGVKIPHFDFGNSPLEFTGSAVCGKIIILVTTNGTAAVRASEPALNVLVAGFLNATAVAQRICELNTSCVIICAGTRYHACVEDTICAGFIAYSCLTRDPKLRPTGRARFCIDLYKRIGTNPTRIAGLSRNAKRLVKLGYNRDVSYCLRVDETPVVPELRGGHIVWSQT